MRHCSRGAGVRRVRTWPSELDCHHAQKPHKGLLHQQVQACSFHHRPVPMSEKATAG